MVQVHRALLPLAFALGSIAAVLPADFQPSPPQSHEKSSGVEERAPQDSNVLGIPPPSAPNVPGFPIPNPPPLGAVGKPGWPFNGSPFGKREVEEARSNQEARQFSFPTVQPGFPSPPSPPTVPGESKSKSSSSAGSTPSPSGGCYFTPPPPGSGLTPPSCPPSGFDFKYTAPPSGSGLTPPVMPSFERKDANEARSPKAEGFGFGSPSGYGFPIQSGYPTPPSAPGFGFSGENRGLVAAIIISLLKGIWQFGVPTPPSGPGFGPGFPGFGPGFPGFGPGHKTELSQEQRDKLKELFEAIIQSPTPPNAPTPPSSSGKRDADILSQKEKAFVESLSEEQRNSMNQYLDFVLKKAPTPPSPPSAPGAGFGGKRDLNNQLDEEFAYIKNFNQDQRNKVHAYVKYILKNVPSSPTPPSPPGFGFGLKRDAGTLSTEQRGILEGLLELLLGSPTLPGSAPPGPPGSSYPPGYPFNTKETTQNTRTDEKRQFDRPPGPPGSSYPGPGLGGGSTSPSSSKSASSPGKTGIPSAPPGPPGSSYPGFSFSGETDVPSAPPGPPGSSYPGFSW